MKPRPPNPKQMRFATEYVKDHNAKQAAIRAGYSKKTAGEQGHRLKNTPSVKAEIERLEGNLLDQLGITAYKILEGVLEVANSGEKDADRLKAYDMLGKRLGWADKVEVVSDFTFTLDIPTPNER